MKLLNAQPLHTDRYDGQVVLDGEGTLTLLRGRYGLTIDDCQGLLVRNHSFFGIAGARWRATWAALRFIWQSTKGATA